MEEVRAADGIITESHLGMGCPCAEVLILRAELGANLLVVGNGRTHAVRHAVSARARRKRLVRELVYVRKAKP